MAAPARAPPELSVTAPEMLPVPTCPNTTVGSAKPQQLTTRMHAQERSCLYKLNIRPLHPRIGVWIHAPLDSCQVFCALRRCLLDIACRKNAAIECVDYGTPTPPLLHRGC